MIKEFNQKKVLNYLLKWESILFIIFLVVMFINSNLSPYFLDTVNLLDNTFNFMEKSIIVLPMMFIIICGDIDISVASIIALSSVFMGYASSQGANTFTILMIGLATGILAGFFNGIIITKIKVPAIAVTIGTMSLFRGIAYVILGDQAYTKYPESFSYFGQGYIGNTMVPFQLVLFLALAVGFGFALHKTTFGRRLYSIGNNATAAKFSGINVDRIRLIIFTLTGALSGLAAVLLSSRYGSTRPNIAYGWELEIITIVVLGGVSIMGGKGNIFGVFISILLIGYLKFGMSLINVPGKVMNIVVGFLLIIAVLLTNMLNKKGSRSVT